MIVLFFSKPRSFCGLLPIRTRVDVTGRGPVLVRVFVILVFVIVMTVGIRVSGILGGGPGLGDFLVPVTGGGKHIFDFGGFGRHLVIDEPQGRRQAKARPGTDQGAQTPAGLAKGLLGTLPLTLLSPLPSQLGPVDLGYLQVVCHP